MSITNDIREALRNFAHEVTAKSSGSLLGDPEDQLRAPFETLMKAVGTALNKDVICVGETRLAERQGRPDYGVTEGGLLTGYAELKAPGKGVAKSQFSGHDLAQFNRFSRLSNVLYSDGNNWAVYHSGRMEGKSIRLDGDVSKDGAGAIGDNDDAKLLALLTRFLDWNPVIPKNRQGGIDFKEFAKQLAPLCKFLRDDVKEALGDLDSPLNGVAREWRELLFPHADDSQFADSYSQTVTFALMLARRQGAGSDGSPLTFENAQKALENQHSLLSVALEALTDRDVRRELGTGLDSLLRLVGSVPVVSLNEEADTSLYFYEDFLAEYDAKLRKNVGVYYTPVEVVRAQVRLLDDLLTSRLDKPLGFADPSVITIDPGTGTGTYLLGIIEHSMPKLSARSGSGAASGYATQLGNNLNGFELLVGPYAVTELRLANALRASGAATTNGPQIYLADTLESPERQPPQGNLYVQRELAKQTRLALEVKKAVNVLVCIGNPPYDRAPAADSSGGWVRHGEKDVDDRPILEDFLEPARKAGHGGDLKNLYNLYVYFWRWGLWKVFEQDAKDGPGIVSFITASSYLDGDAFSGMREHMRSLCDEIWIIDLGGEGRGPRKSENVFNIQTPVAIAVACRKSLKATGVPAKVHYTRIEGTRTEKLAALD